MPSNSITNICVVYHLVPELQGLSAEWYTNDSELPEGDDRGVATMQSGARVADKWNEIEVEVKGPAAIKTGEAAEVETSESAVSQVEEVENKPTGTDGGGDADDGLKVKGEAEASDDGDDDEKQAADGIEGRRAQKRIKRLVREKKALKQQFENELSKEREEREALAARLKAIEEGQARTAENQAVQYERGLEEKLKQAGRDWQAAFDAGDKDGMLAAQEAQVDLKLEKRRLDDWKRQKAAAPKQQAETPVRQQAAEAKDEGEAPTIVPKAQEWIGKQKWWNKDRILTAATAAIAGELEEAGYDPNDDDYYGEVERRLKSEFPGKFAPTAASKPSQVVAGQSRSPAPNKVRLTAEDQRLARLFGVSLEDYARSKQQTESAGTGYVPIEIKTR